MWRRALASVNKNGHGHGHVESEGAAANQPAGRPAQRSQRPQQSRRAQRRAFRAPTAWRSRCASRCCSIYQAVCPAPVAARPPSALVARPPGRPQKTPPGAQPTFGSTTMRKRKTSRHAQNSVWKLRCTIVMFAHFVDLLDEARTRENRSKSRSTKAKQERPACPWRRWTA